MQFDCFAYRVVVRVVCGLFSFVLLYTCILSLPLEPFDICLVIDLRLTLNGFVDSASMMSLSLMCDSSLLIMHTGDASNCTRVILRVFVGHYRSATYVKCGYKFCTCQLTTFVIYFTIYNLKVLLFFCRKKKRKNKKGKCCWKNQTLGIC